ncbi:hypothetical protein FXF51_01855 [Nonomuraea sp. PA05]|uniref:hypothetical protein n=1 Tax=Nonomuraea sp. PA05 TaxID=2604466 RepID=UPI0011D881BF|nr:hypothetical protein [Nonomuraea sp. PA05]TYB71205.1 hypothetical protein FXF51_01855 [Nonomuraea sp. PA05]
MVSFACIAYVLERAADIMLGDHGLDPEQALTRAIWGDQPAHCDDCGQQARYQVAARALELHYASATFSTFDGLTSVDVAHIPTGSARSTAREVARLFRQVEDWSHQNVEGSDLDEVAQAMWGQAHAVELARCS